MSKNVHQTVLDPSKKVARVSYSDEHPNGIHYDTDGNQIAYVEELVEYKPIYDIEVSGKPWSFNFKFDVYVDVHAKVISFWFPSYWLGHLLVALPVIKVNKFYRTML